MDDIKKHIITIGGRPGSGKSTTAKGIAEQMGFMHFSSGDLFRAISKEHGQDVLQSNLAAEKSEDVSTIDQLVDQRLRDLGEQEDQLVVDSRMAWHWMPFSFKVFLDLDFETAAKRILSSMTPERIAAEHIPDNPEEYAQSLLSRLESESRRYKKFYNVDPYSSENYNLVVDTKVNSPDQVIAIILSEYKKWLSAE
jgi:cytidylate kinase